MAIRWSTACGQAFFIEVKRGPNVGAGLLANAAYQLTHPSLTHCIREQARSHIGFVVCLRVIELQ